MREKKREKIILEEIPNSKRQASHHRIISAEGNQQSATYLHLIILRKTHEVAALHG
jgi:hypothetical protein